MIGANGVLNRVAEDAYCWMVPQTAPALRNHLPNHHAGDAAAGCHDRRQPGDVYKLGEAYAFARGVELLLKSLGVLAFATSVTHQEYKVPLNLHIGGWRFPSGLGVTTLMLGFVAIATSVFENRSPPSGGRHVHISGLPIVFTISERINAAQACASASGEEASRGVQSRSTKIDQYGNVARRARVRAGGPRARTITTWTT